MKRVMVDMSATLIHHGHVRLLKKASEHGRVIVALTTDDEIKTKKGYQPEISFEHRKEILEAIRYVDAVVPSPWLIEEAFLIQHKIDLLVHGDDNSNPIDENKLLVFPRTSEISSTLLRQRAKRIIEDCTK
ncbi:MAG: adenylyltransferase/cytidyltransferase family protein [Betaproteobacteria bacterium]|nr:adenylyltransferase/cytidyltransferase family protein [Betaproteobacteria bacterium]